MICSDGLEVKEKPLAVSECGRGFGTNASEPAPAHWLLSQKAWRPLEVDTEEGNRFNMQMKYFFSEKIYWLTDKWRMEKKGRDL